MKTMTCRQLGGACDQEFHAASFEEMAELSKQHGREMFEKGDLAHINAMKEMQAMLNTPDAMKAWFDEKRKAFNQLPNHD